MDSNRKALADTGWTVGQVAELTGITVRTLHHYDEIGLLRPSGRSRAAYRLYGEADLRRLHQILLFRELGFTLEVIQQLVDDPGFDRRQALETQRALLVERMGQTQAIVRGIDRALAELNGEGIMKTEELFEGFEEANRQYEDEVKERWGDTEAYRESARRTKKYTKEDWKRFKVESEEAGKRWIALLAAGADPMSPAAMDLAEGARLQIDRWFYPCSPEMHRKLADMYEADPRFTATYEKMAPGMTAFVSAAIRANADRQDRKARG
jgi:DNA-binding transcriptional MerR regulator